MNEQPAELEAPATKRKWWGLMLIPVAFLPSAATLFTLKTGIEIGISLLLIIDVVCSVSVGIGIVRLSKERWLSGTIIASIIAAFLFCMNIFIVLLFVGPLGPNGC